MARYKIQQQSQGNLVITIPKVLAEILNMNKGDSVEWRLKKGELSIKKVI